MKSTGVENIARPHGRVLKALTAAALLFILSQVHLFADYQVYVDAYIGFNGAFQASGNVPVRLRVRNEGRGCSGELYLQTVDEQGRILYRTSRYVELPPGAGKEISFNLELRSTSERLFTGLLCGEEQVVEKKVDLGRRWYARPLVLAVARPGAFDFLLEVPVVSDVGFPVVHVHPQDLPPGNAGYEGVGLVILHDVFPAHLDTLQVEALTRWIDAGGCLLISYNGTPTTHTVDDTPLMGLLQLSWRGVRILEELKLSTDPPIIVEGPVPVMDTLPGSDGRFVRESFGAGSIVCIPFDSTAAALGLENAVRYWSSLPIEIFHTSFHEPVVSGMERIPEHILKAELKRFPGRKEAVFFTAGVLLLFFSGSFLLRRGLRLYAVLFYSVFSLLSVSGVFLLFYYPGRGPGPVMASFSLLEGTSERSYASVRTGLHLFSPLPETTAVVLPEGCDMITGDRPVYVHRNEEPVLENISFDCWDERYFESGTVIPFSLRCDMESDILRVENNSRYSIHGGFIFHRENIFRVGGIPAGGVAEASDETLTMAPGQVLPETVISDVTETRGYILRDVFSDEAFLEFLSGTGPVFIGWLEDPQFAGRPKADRTEVYSEALVVIRLEQKEWFP